MGYKRADEILPEDILKTLQEYVSGETIYVPKREEMTRQKWGVRTGMRENLCLRNSRMYAEHLEGMSTKQLAEKYYLTEKSVQRILRTIRANPPMENETLTQGGQKIE